MVLEVFVVDCDCGHTTADFFLMDRSRTYDFSGAPPTDRPRFEAGKERARKRLARKYAGGECASCFKRFRRRDHDKTWRVVAVPSTQVNDMMDVGRGGSVVLGRKHLGDGARPRSLAARFRQRLHLIRLKARL